MGVVTQEEEKIYADLQTPEEVKAIRDLNLEIGRHEFTATIGQNRCGKTGGGV